MSPCSTSHHFQTMHYCTSNILAGEPSYLFHMLSLTPKPRELRSSGFHLLFVPRVKTHCGTRVVSVDVLTLWNSLSEQVTTSNFSDLLILPHFPLHLIICWWTLHCTLTMSLPNPFITWATELDSLWLYWRNRSFVINNYYSRTSTWMNRRWILWIMSF